MTRIDELLKFHAQARMGAIGLVQHNKVQQYTKTELKQLILSALPEKKRATGDLDSDYTQGLHCGYNQALEEVTKALTALFEGEQSK